MKKEWLIKRTTTEEAEHAHLVTSSRLGPDPVPFGYQNDRWRELKSRMEAGDELWEFSSPEESWKNLAGRAGFCVVRNGKIVDFLVTIMN